MLYFAHEGHVHADEIAPAVTTDDYSMNYAGYFILLIGLLLLIAGAMLLISAFSNKSQKDKKPN